MGLLEQSQRSYYQDPSDYGSYQFTSLEDIINHFMVVYVGEEKIIQKISRTDVAFHAQRALAELSFDTFKSVKSQEIVLPPSLTMILPHDYINYTKLSWSDSAGIKRVLYPASKTSNPFKVSQNDDGSYDLRGPTSAIMENNDFSVETLGTVSSPGGGWIRSNYPGNPTIEKVFIDDEILKFRHGSRTFSGTWPGTSSRAYAVWQQITVTDMDYLDIEATGLSAAASSGVKGAGVIRFGITTLNPTESAPSSTGWNANLTNPLNPDCLNDDISLFNLQTDGEVPSYVEFNDGAGTASTKELAGVNVVDLDTVYLLITSHIPSYSQAWTSSNENESINTLDDVSVIFDGVLEDLQTEGDSSTWTNYKSAKPSENNTDDYQDDTYWRWESERYGIDPQHSQVNGSFYVDDLKGLVHFSSNVSGKTVILDYISDSLGTDGEMQVHKFAEEAMYKWIMHAVLSTRMGIPEYVINRYKKERFAAIRQAKLRLSNIKLEEITQVFRGKSKHIKH